MCTTAALLNVLHPEISSSSHIWIWTAMNVLPKVLGVILMTGVLFAGFSSATTFLSLIGASIANDIVPVQRKNSIKYGRIAMVVVSSIVLACALTNPPAIFAIMFLGGATAASSWMPVAFGSIFSKRMTEVGAFYGMIVGMLGVLVANFVQKIFGFTLPSYLDPAIIGIVCNVITIIVVSRFTKVSNEEKVEREKLFVIPEKEKDPVEMKKTLNWSKWAVLAGVAVFALVAIFWAIPYMGNL